MQMGMPSLLPRRFFYLSALTYIQPQLVFFCMLRLDIKIMNKEQISGRFDEKQRLQKLLESPDPELLAVYGRRRVGKTFLITRFFGTFAFEMTGMYDVPAGKQLSNFAEALGTDRVPDSWLEAFRLLREHLEEKRQGHKQVVFFDELPWLATRKSGFLPAFEHFWNSWGSRQPDLLVVVCGSAAAWMIRKIVNQRGGLHGRVTCQMELSPFNLCEAHEYLRSRNFPDSRSQTLELYMAVGGVPLYLQKARPELSAAQNIDALCFAPGAPLWNEFDQIYASLFEHHDRHLQIIRTLADVQQGLTRPEIQLKSNLASGGTLSQTLEELHRSGFITVTVPFGRIRRDALY
jgi:hypothetical protein